MLRKSLPLFCLVFLTASNAKDGDSRVVNTAQGPVKGYKDPEYGFYTFMSIPYAAAPTGPNRFKAPLPPPKWMYTLEAVDKRIICPQATFPIPVMPLDLIMQEDCLILNIYVPDTNKKNLPVVFYVHGGAFQMGYGEFISPSKFVADSQFIFVNFNYRLGPHGFLSLGTDDIPGNAGMKDQVAALRWVKENIASFGGNPEDITLQGSSAGSASVDLLMLSKTTEGLFNKVIPESGSNTAVWAIQSDPLETAKWFATTLNFNNVEDIYALEKFYKTVSFDQLLSNAFFDQKDSTFVFSPCVERVTDSEAFLDKSPIDILKSGDYVKVPLLYGFADMEGLLREAFFENWHSDMNNNFSDFLPADLKFESTEQKEEIARRVKEFYFEDKAIGTETILQYVDYFSDVFFAYSTLRSVKYHVEAGHNQVYLYEYSFVDDNTPVVSHTNVKGANHGAQSLAVFDAEALAHMPKITKTDEFKTMVKVIRKIWANFIEKGVPNTEGVPEWPAVGAGWSPHMSLGNEISLRGPLLERRMRFWDDIYSEHYRNPVPPPKPAPRRTEL